MSEQSGHQIFISYKFHDTDVEQNVKHALFEAYRPYGERTPRDYVNVLETYIEDYSAHYYKGEDDGEPLDGKSDAWIWEQLKDRIFYSSLTIVIVSPNMKTNLPENKQWIPQEIHYSLCHETRHNEEGEKICSRTNAIFAIVLPDRNGSYEYYFENKNCCASGCRLNKTNTLFWILKKNTFNRKKPNSYQCDIKDTIYKGDMHSFIPFYKWCDVNSPEKIEKVITHAYEILDEKDEYDIEYSMLPNK